MVLTDAGIQGAYIALGIILILVLVCVIIVFLMWRRSVVRVKDVVAFFACHSCSLVSSVNFVLPCFFVFVCFFNLEN